MTSAYPFTADDADIVIRASRSDVPREFRLHKTILSITSPVFKGMFDIPQPISSTTLTGPEIPVIDLDETPKDLELFLRMIYPFEFPRMPTLDAIVHAFGMLDKYEVGGRPLQTLRSLLVSPRFLEHEPIKVYSIACHWKFKEEADLAAPYTSHLNVTSLAKTEDLQRMTGVEYHRLISLSKQRKLRCAADINGWGIPSTGCSHSKCKIFYLKFRSRLMKEFEGGHYDFYDLGWCTARCFEVAILEMDSSEFPCEPATGDSSLARYIVTLAKRLSARP